MTFSNFSVVVHLVESSCLQSPSAMQALFTSRSLLVIGQGQLCCQNHVGKARQSVLGNSCVLGKKRTHKRQDLVSLRGHSDNSKRSVLSDALPLW
jgi:hypothetical protein